jgi:hypothetical protein
VTPKVNRCLIDELLADVVIDYEVNKKRSLKKVKRLLKLHLAPHFGGWRAAAISAADVRSYVAKRQQQGAANGQINRELSMLTRAFVLGCEGGKVLTRPKIAKLQENNVRQASSSAPSLRRCAPNCPRRCGPWSRSRTSRAGGRTARC